MALTLQELLVLSCLSELKMSKPLRERLGTAWITGKVLLNLLLPLVH